MENRFLKFSSLVLGLLLVLATACAASEKSPAADEGAGPAEKGAPKRGGTFRLSAGSSSWHTNEPAFGQTAYSNWVFFGLPMIYKDPETYKLDPKGPSVVESWEYSPDGKDLVLKIRKGVRFHNKPPINGREVEAKDLVYSVKGCTGKLYPDLPSVRFPAASVLSAFRDAVAVDKYTVKVTLSQPSVSFLDGLSFYRCTWIVPDGIREHFGGIESLFDPDYGAERYISAGPFQVKKIQNLVEAVFERNPNYYQEGKPYLDQVKFTWIPDSSTELAAFIAGQLDARNVSGAEDLKFITDSVPDTQVQIYKPRICWYRLSFNTTRKPFDDARVRRAIALVIDSKELGAHLFGSWKGEQLWRYPPPIPFVFPEAIPQEELAKHPLYLGPTPENVAKAKKLLAEAGYASGFEFEMMMPKGSQNVDSAQIMQQQIEKNLPGVKFKINSVDAAINFKRAIDADYDVQNYCHIHQVNAAAQMHEAFHSQGSRNYGRFKDSKMDELIEKADRELNDARYRELMRQIQDYVLETLAMYPLYARMDMGVAQPYMRDMRLGGGNYYWVNVADYWVDK